MVAQARRLDAQYSLLHPAPPLKRHAPRPVESPLQIVPPAPLPDLSDTVRELRASFDAGIAAKLTSGTELIRSLARQRREEVIPTTLPGIDALLGGGLARGKMTEIAGRGGRWSVVMATLAAATAMGLGLLQHESNPAAIHRVLPPGGLRKNAREIRFVGAL